MFVIHVTFLFLNVFVCEGTAPAASCSETPGPRWVEAVCGSTFSFLSFSSSLMVFVFQPLTSDHGLLTTVAYKLGKDKPACYALEVLDLLLGLQVSLRTRVYSDRP